MPELQDRLTAILHDHYAILREVGHGGMAIVYLARDLKHDREVALKVLHPQFAASLGAERFLREVRVAARLHHPHLLPLYDSGEADGLLYYVVPYVEGGSLRDRLRREGPLPCADALQLTREAAGALDYAHRRNVVHRDIKPENILLDEGHAIVADFGVARALSAAAETQITEAGFLVGTPAYMSPEQASGDPVDGRSDIYSLGCVLFELVTGSPPFTGSTPIGILSQRLTNPAPRVSERGASVPPEVEDAIDRALARQPEQRFQTAAELAHALSPGAMESSPTGTPPSLRRTPRAAALAVLPFVNLSSDAENEYFSDGMSEELINALTKVPGLRVTARTSAFAFKGKDVDVREIGQKLNVGSVLEGSIRRAGSRIRLTAQLVNTADGYYVWSESFDREMADIFAVQDELSRAIAGSLKLHLVESDVRPKPPTRNVHAYTLYLKGLSVMNRRSVEGYRGAIELFKAAVEKDPEYAPPHAGIAHAYTMLGFDWWSGMPSLEAMPLAKAAAARALDLDGTLAESHTAMAMIQMLFDWDWTAADAAFRRSIELSPGHAPAHHWFSHLLATRNRHEESIREIRKAQELDPLAIIINQNLGRVYHYARRYDEAVEHYRRTLELDPNYFTTHVMLAQSLSQLSRHQEALEAVRAAQAAAGPLPLIQAELTGVLASLGRREEATRIVQELDNMAQRQYVPLYYLARAHYAVGQEERAIALLEDACEQRSTLLPWLGCDLIFGTLRDHPKFLAILERLDLPNQSLPQA